MSCHDSYRCAGDSPVPNGFFEMLRGPKSDEVSVILSDSLAEPPGSPADGDRYIVAPSPTGAWAGQAGKIAAWIAGAWVFLTPKTGWRAWVVSRTVAVVYSGSAWQSEPSLTGFRNRLRNASFAINQRNMSGTVVLVAGQYGHDGVKAGAAGCTYTFATSGLDTTIIISAGSLIMPIEDALIEGDVYAFRHDGTAQARVWQGTGSTGSGSYATAPFQTSSLTAATQTNVEFSVGTVLRPQFEPGSYATAFERRPPSIEMALCQRYYQILFGTGGPQAPAIVQGSFMSATLLSGVEMRATPTLAHNLTDANFASGTGPTGSQWGMSPAGASWVTKTGTLSINFMTTKRAVSIRTTGASFSPVPNSIGLGVNVYVGASAEI
jgi:hypothetical protein